jgi:hypothetical protein
MWPWELGAISGIACQSTAHHLLSAGQMMGNKRHTVPGVALNSLNFHPGVIHGPDLKIIAPFAAMPLNSSHYFLFNPRIIPQILVAEITPCSSFQHSFIACISYSIISPKARALKEDHRCRKGGRMTIIADNGRVV